MKVLFALSALRETYIHKSKIHIIFTSYNRDGKVILTVLSVYNSVWSTGGINCKTGDRLVNDPRFAGRIQFNVLTTLSMTISSFLLEFKGL